MSLAAWVRFCLTVPIASLTACAVPVQRTAYFISAPSGDPTCRSALVAVRAYALAHGYQEYPTPIVPGGSGPLPNRLGTFVRVNTVWPVHSSSALFVDCAGNRLQVTAQRDGESDTRERQRLYDGLVVRFPHLHLDQREYRDSFGIITGDF